ncbi:MAG: FtsX-like permease family protein [Nitrospinales bacterium]
MKPLSYLKELAPPLILRPLIRDPFRTLITILGVAIGVSVFQSIQIANQKTLSSFKESVDLVLGRADAVIHADGMAFDEKVFEQLLALRQSIKAYPVIEGYGVELRTNEVVQILGTDLLQDSGIRDFSLKTVEKDLKGLLPLVLDPEGIILLEKFIPDTDFQPGESIQFVVNGMEKSLNINAILENKGIAKALNGNFAMMDIAAAQLLFNKIGKLDRIDVEFLEKDSFEHMREKISSVLPSYLRVDRPERKNQQVEKMLRAFQYNLSALSFVALIVALYLIFNMISLSVVRRRMEIGALRAMGATPGMIALIFILEAGILGLIGSLIGVGLGYYFAQFSLQAITFTVNNLYVPSQTTEVTFHWSQTLPYLALGVGMSFVSALIPAYDAAKTPPTLVMRRGSYDLKVFHGNRRLNQTAVFIFIVAAACASLPPIDHFPYFGFASVFLLILGFSLLSPSLLVITRDALRGLCKRLFHGEGLLACLNLVQNVGRNSIAVSSLAIAFMMIISMSIMVTSFRQTVIVWIGQTLRADLFVRTAGGTNIDYQYTLPETPVEKLKKIPGVAAVDLFRAMDISYNDEPVILASGDFSVLSKYGNLVIKRGPPAAELDRYMVGQNRTLISEAFSLKHGVDVGDHLTLETPNGTLDLEIVCVYYDYSQERGYIILDRTIYSKYYDDRDVNSFVIYLSDKKTLPEVRREILQTIGKDHKILIRTNSELKEEVLKIFDQTFAITYSLEIIAILVAVLGLFNTLVSLIIERKREIGILRFIGAFKPQIKRMILIEAGLLGLIGSVIGLIAGMIVSYILIFVINKQSFGWTIQMHFPYVFILLTTTIFWGVSYVAGFYPARLAVRQNPIETVRVE